MTASPGLQDALVLLATDRPARRRFAADRGAVLAGHALTDRERAALLALPLDALDRYAAGLEHKRWSEVARIVPRTLRIVPELPNLYRGWLGAHPAPAEDTVLSPGAAEALRALPALRTALADEERHASYAADLLCYEALAAASREDTAPRGMRSRFAVHELIRVLDAGSVPFDPDPAPHVYRFERARVAWRPA